MIESKAKQIIESTFSNVLTALNYPNYPIVFRYEKIGGRFLTIDNSAEYDSKNRTVFINEDWANNRIETFPYDLYYISAHEARHVYQHIQIELLLSNNTIREDRKLIETWMNNFRNYIRNQGGNTIAPYHRQPVEVDADAFANVYMLINGKECRVPVESDDLVSKRIIEIGNQLGFTIQEP